MNFSVDDEIIDSKVQIIIRKIFKDRAPNLFELCKILLSRLNHQTLSKNQMELISTLPIDTTSFNDLEESLIHDYGLVIRAISEMNHSFERALSICLFGN